jgi:hypothetical protein
MQVLLSFVIVSWITVFVAGVPAIYEAVERCRARHEDEVVERGGQQGPILRSDLDRRPFLIIAKKCEKLLGILCDLQAITGIGIIIAGWAQIRTINYYHEELIMAYWWLTLNSFWIGRADYLNLDSKDDKIRILIRRLTILYSCILGISFQGHIVVREETWTDNRGPCYKYQDGSSAIPWMVGLGIFCLALSLVIFEKTRKFIKQYLDKTKSASKITKEWCENSHRTLDESISQSIGVPAPRRILKLLKPSFVVAFTWICRGFWLTLVLWLSVWSYGEGPLPATFCVYFLFNVWNTFDVISIWRLNQTEIDGDERRMGFGQILPLVLIASIMFSAIDIFQGKPDDDFITAKN